MLRRKKEGVKGRGEGKGTKEKGREKEEKKENKNCLLETNLLMRIK